jgi:small-conductance mechanosensitive channel
MKLLFQTWEASTLNDWMLAAAIALGVLIALMVAKAAAIRALKALATRIGTTYADTLIATAAATRWWLMVPVALYAGLSALELPGRLDRLSDIVVVIVLMLQAALWINRYITVWMERRVAQRSATDSEAVTALALLGFAARVLVWAITLLLVLNHLSFDVTALVTGLGIGGVAVALAVQNVLGDLFASLSIVLDKPFVVGDFIVVDSLRGTVEQVGIKTTRLRSLDGELLVFSNADLLKSRIRNFKRMVDRRIEFTLGVAYHTPLEKLRAIPQWIAQIVAAQPRTRLDRAHFKQYGDSALVFEVVYFVLDPDYNPYMDAQQAINLAIFERFAREGVEFAYPTRTLLIRREPAAQAA